MLFRLIDKASREFYRLFHPALWGKNTQINGIPRIFAPNRLSIGRNVSLNSGVVLQCYGGLTIGDNVTISDGAKLLTRSLDTRRYIENAKKAERDHLDREIVIGDGVWIAANAVVLQGVHIAENCIIAAGAVVNRDLPSSGCLYAGVPAKKVRELNHEAASCNGIAPESRGGRSGRIESADRGTEQD